MRPMNKGKVKTLIAALALLSMPALATDVEFNWTFTPEREDGTPATIAEVGGYTIYLVDPTVVEGDIIPGTAATIKSGIISTATSYIHPDFEGLGSGMKSFAITVTDVEGMESVASVVQKINLSRLKAPGLGPLVIILSN
jgi:hypothetical protein